MKKILITVSILIAILTLTGCSAFIEGFVEGLEQKSDTDTDEVQTVKSNESSLSLVFPGSWSNGKLNDMASLEMARMSKEQYLIVLEDPRIDFDDDLSLDEFTLAVMENMMNSIDGGNGSELMDAYIGNHINAKQFELSGSVERIKVKYLVTCADVNGIFYRFVTWSTQSKYDEAKPVFDEILNSATFGDIS